jgi:hypothetical protein
MAKLIIERTSEYNNRMRNYKIFMDGQQLDTIGNGGIKEFTISPGRHTLYAKIDWCSSPEISFEITDSATKIFKVGGFKHSNWIMPLALIILFVSYIVKKTTGIDWLIYLVIPPFLLLMYYISIGRKKYLTIKEI